MKTGDIVTLRKRIDYTAFEESLMGKPLKIIGLNRWGEFRCMFNQFIIIHAKPLMLKYFEGTELTLKTEGK